jgi:hypothetical protein
MKIDPHAQCGNATVDCSRLAHRGSGSRFELRGSAPERLHSIDDVLYLVHANRYTRTRAATPLLTRWTSSAAAGRT